MSRSAIAFLAFRLLAIYCWIETVMLGWNAAILWMQARRGTAHIEDQFTGALAISIVSAPILLFVCGSVLFAWAPVLANKMFPDQTAEPKTEVPGIGGLALRVMGVLFAVRALELVPGAVRMQRATWGLTSFSPFTAHLVEIAVLLLLSAALIVFGPRMARWLLHDRSRGTPDPRTARFQTITFAVIGVWLVVSGLPQVIVMLVSFSSPKADVYNESLSSLSNGPLRAQQWISILQVVAGVALFVGSRGLSALWHRIRTAGLDEARGGTRGRTG